MPTHHQTATPDDNPGPISSPKSNPTLIQQHFKTPGSHMAYHADGLQQHESTPKSHKPKVAKRTSFDSSKIEWDGKIDTFPPVEAVL